MRKNKALIVGPHAVCQCEHTGDGPNSDHYMKASSHVEGHGSCRVKSCTCQMFVWKAWLPTYQEYLDRHLGRRT